MRARAQRGAGFAAAAVLLAALLAAASVPLVSGIDDADFFWHLQTGAWIWEHSSLPGEFLFSLTAPATMTDSMRFTMTSYWLVQVVYHLLYAAGGLVALALLRCAMMALLVGSLFLRRGRSAPLVFLGSALLGVITFRIYTFERPQVVSFVLFSLLLAALERLTRAPADEAPPRAALLALPAIMVVWANAHAGYLVGQGVILLWLAAEGLKFSHRALQPLPGSRYRLLLAAGAAGLLASLLNPNTWRGLAVADLPAWLTAGNLEYQSTVTFFRATNSPAIPVFWLLLVLAALGLSLRWRRPDVTELALVAGTGVVAFFQIRHLAFFVVSAVPVIAAAFSRQDAPRAARALVLAPALAAGLFLLPRDLPGLLRPGNVAAVSPLNYPVDAADFVKSARLPGNMYNYWPWGGYLLWRLHPAKAFSDGRNSLLSVHQLNAAVEAGSGRRVDGRPLWESIFRSYGIRYAILPIFNPRQGDVPDLLFSLLESRQWRPVFIGVNSVVFVEAGSGAGEAPPPSREQALHQLLRRCDELTRRLPVHPFPHIAQGDLLVALGRFADARVAYRRALALAPLNPLASSRLTDLGRMAGRP